MKNNKPTTTTHKWIKIAIACVLIAGIACLMLHGYFVMRGHGGAELSTVSFEESGKRLHNPNRGFYFLHGYYIYDKMVDYREQVAKDYYADTETTITLVEINLAEFKNSPISEQGLQNVDNLFGLLHGLNKQLIVRFLYDWDGENEGNEPKSLDIVLGHMEQLGPIINAHAEDIFILQGLFIGNWGEMNGTKYANQADIKTLANKLADVTSPDIYLAVRMPMHWRMATDNGANESLAKRMSLFNDGMLGSASDYGTYGDQSKKDVGDYSYWNREEELEFQDELCKTVPNGGEVIVPNSYNDFDASITDFNVMHVSYLNLEFDARVYDKWNKETVSDGSVFDGQAGKFYIENHLGYRFVITDNQITYNAIKDTASVAVEFKNAGFAPIYDEAEISITMVNKETGERLEKPVASKLCTLSGGTSDDRTSVDVTFKMTGQKPGNYDVYISIKDQKSAMPIYLGVEQELTDDGYLLGTITLHKKSF